MKLTKGLYPKLATFTERLNHAYSNQNKSQSKIAEEVGFSQPSFSDLLSGKNKSSRKAEKIAEALGVDSQWLITGIQSEESSSVSLVQIPLLQDYAEYSNTRSRIQFKKPAYQVQLDINALRNRGINFYDTNYIPMPDKGMGLVIKEDASVFFDRSKTLVEDGGIYVFSHGGMLQVRTLFNAPMGAIRVEANNAQFTTYTLDLLEQDEQLFSVIGQVFAVVNYY